MPFWLLQFRGADFFYITIRLGESIQEGTIINIYILCGRFCARMQRAYRVRYADSRYKRGESNYYRY